MALIIRIMDHFDAAIRREMLEGMIGREQTAVDSGTNQYAAMRKNGHSTIRAAFQFIEKGSHTGV